MSVKLKPLNKQVIVITGASSGIGLTTDGSFTGGVVLPDDTGGDVLA